MAETFFLDTNILMYAVGSEHPLKRPCLDILSRITVGEIVAVTDTEVFQEVAYRYWCQKKWDVAAKVLKDYEDLFSEIYSIEKDHLDIYYQLLTHHHFLSPRDAIHVAVMQSHQINLIYTVDKAFTQLPFLKVTQPS